MKNFRLSWISERSNFSNAESLCHCVASHQVSAQSNLPFGRCLLKNFKMVALVAILDIRTILAILNLHADTVPPTKFHTAQSNLGSGDVENVKSLQRTTGHGIS